ncbi:MAG: polysaccharide deacetylase family protein [Clostridia bacterium]|nr:polysaccharide deacetylase family protein [Clostridia bacterium]
MKKIIVTLVLLLMTFLLSFNVGASNCFSWYCKRNSQHAQPTLGSDLKFVEKYDLFWKDNTYEKIDDDKKIIYLTFDAGYENGNIEKILDILKEEKVKASFFILDNLLNKNTDLVFKMLEDGHIVCNHTLKHKDMSKITTKEAFNNELEALNELFLEKTGKVMPKFYRPPEGRFSEDNLKWAKELGYKTIMWSFAYDDWDNGKQRSEEYAFKKIMDNIHNGEVMLLHPTSETNAKILKKVILSLKEQGFEFGNLNQLCENSK